MLLPRATVSNRVSQALLWKPPSSGQASSMSPGHGHLTMKGMMADPTHGLFLWLFLELKEFIAAKDSK